jgi:predicted PurR-regulated permease PerM
MDIRKIQISFFLALFIGAIALTGLLLWPFVTPIALAFMCAVLVQPIQTLFEKITHGRSGIAATLSIVFLLIVLVVPLFFLGTALLRESYNLYFDIREKGLGNLDALSWKVIEPIQKIIPGFDPKFEEYVSGFAEWFVSNLGSFFSKTATIVFNLFLGGMTLFYLLKDGNKLRKAITKLSPLADTYDKEIIDRLERAVNSVVKGSVLVSLVQGVLTGIGLSLFGIEHSVLWGSVAAVAALVPGFGTSIVLIPAIAYLFLVGSNGPAFGLLAWSVVAVGLIDNILLPSLVGKKFKAHPLFVLLAVLGGIYLFGPIGLFLGPLIIAFLLALMDIYKLFILGESASSVR